MEVGLQEVSVAVAVFRAVEHGIDIAKDVLRAEGAGAVTSTIRNEVETDGGCKRSSELVVEVRFPRVDSVRQSFRWECVKGKEVVDFLERNRVVLNEVP